MTNAETAQAWLQEGAALHKSGRLPEAEALYRRVLAFDSRHFDALHLLGVVALDARNFLQADALIAAALEINPKSAAAHHNRGNALRALKRFDAAIANYDAAIALKPGYAEAFSNRAVALMEKHDYQAAVTSCDQALAIRPDDANIHNNRGVALREMARHGEALASFDAAVRLNPGHFEAHCNRGISLNAVGRHEAALAAYDTSIGLNPAYAEAYCSRGLALSALQRYVEAVECYGAAIRLNAGFAEAHNNRGIALAALERVVEAVESYDRAIQCRPDYGDAYNNRGHALLRLRRYDEAVRDYDKALAINPAQPFLYGTRLYAKAQICDWRDIIPETAILAEKLQRGDQAITPFPVLALLDSPSLQHTATATWMREKGPYDGTLGEIPARRRRDKIRIGYFSMDFRTHPVALLTAGLFEAHDREKFEIYGFSYGSDTQDEMRRRLEKGFDEFIDVRDRLDKDVATLARTMEIDIAVDLAGLTANARTGIFALRAAPVQVNFIGYPGTMAVDYIDYIIADPIVIPARHKEHYIEKVVHLPGSYQVNDDARQAADSIFSRAEIDLPETGFVFCCFNNNFKITPATFDVWMRILKRVEGSVLWLLEDTAAASANLRKEAERRGVEADRLVFAPRLSPGAHLARHRAADLFLDTLPYNAHTTASDALWMGVPMLTCMGEAFASRVAASLLTAIGLPDLIATKYSDYEDMAVALAADRARLDVIKNTLAVNRSKAPLFNTRTYARYIEDAYTQMYERHHAGLPPDHISVGI